MNLFQLEIYNNPILIHTSLEKVSKGKKKGTVLCFQAGIINEETIRNKTIFKLVFLIALFSQSKFFLIIKIEF